MNYKEAEQYLYESLPMFQRVGAAAYKKDLTNTLSILERLDNPQEGLNYVHVAGTNGKGSTSSMLAAILTAQGYKVGLYTSPHLKSFTERIRINGKPIPKQRVAKYVSNYTSIIEDLKPSFFELTTAMAFQYFKEEKVDIAIMEVGMGGRLDSTNVINPLVSVITHIGIDHSAFLGTTIAEIAREKAGIIKEKTPLVYATGDREARKVIRDKAEELKAMAFYASAHYKAIYKPEKECYDVSSRKVEYMKNLRVGLKGSYQSSNLSTVLTVLDVLRLKGFTIEDEAVKSGLENVTELSGIRGRWQQLNDSPRVLCDVGHNVAAFEHILPELEKMQKDKLFIIFGTVSDKEVDKLLDLLPKKAYYYFTQATVPRAMEARELFEMAKKRNLQGEVQKNVTRAYNKAMKQLSNEDVLFIGGSTFVVAEIPTLV